MHFTIPLKKNEDFKKVYRKKKSRADKYFVVFILPNGINQNRIGISVSKKVGNSVIRHRIKRLVREGYRSFEDDLKTGFDIVVMARNSANGADYYTVKNSVYKLLNDHSIVI